jgi:hypothetical protein
MYKLVLIEIQMSWSELVELQLSVRHPPTTNIPKRADQPNQLPVFIIEITVPVLRISLGALIK